MAERLTLHQGYRGRNGKAYNSYHNDREGFEKPGGSDAQNVYWDGGDPEFSFSENEKRFYHKYFEPYIKRKNKTAKDRRQYGRMETLERYKEKHPPEETLLYIGRKDVNPAVLENIFTDFVEWQRSLWVSGEGGYHLLNAALHLDETTPHIHFRGVYMYADKNGDWQVSQNKALEIMGFERPDPTKPPGKYNNAKITYTAKCREKLFEIAESYGVTLEREPLPKNEVGLPLKEYIQREQAREAAVADQQAARQTIAALEATKTGLEDDIAELEEEKDDAQDDLTRIRRSTTREQAAREQKRREIIESAEKEAEKILETAKKQADELREMAVREGATSALGRLNAMRRAEGQDQLTDEQKRENARRDGIGLHY